MAADDDLPRWNVILVGSVNGQAIINLGALPGLAYVIDEVDIVGYLDNAGAAVAAQLLQVNLTSTNVAGFPISFFGAAGTTAANELVPFGPDTAVGPWQFPPGDAVNIAFNSSFAPANGMQCLRAKYHVV